MDSMPRTAFLLQVHKNPEQVNGFINQLVSGHQADIYIHVDKRSREEFEAGLHAGPRITLLKESIECEWGDISQVNATLLLIREALASNQNYDFLCLRSGQDLMVNPGFKQFLRENRNKIFLSYRKMERDELGLMKIRWPKASRKRYTTPHPIRLFRRGLLSLSRKGVNLFPNKKKWKEEFSFYKGSQWFTIPVETARYIIDFIEENKWFHEYFTHTLVPDESYFQTLLMNSPYRDLVVNSNLYFVKWGETLSGRNSPQTLSEADIPAIERSGGFFARKFDSMMDPAIVDYFVRRIQLKGEQEEELLG